MNRSFPKSSVQATPLLPAQRSAKLPHLEQRPIPFQASIEPIQAGTTAPKPPDR